MQTILLGMASSTYIFKYEVRKLWMITPQGSVSNQASTGSLCKCEAWKEICAGAQARIASRLVRDNKYWIQLNLV